MLNLTLPYPPSGNHAWKHTRAGKHYLTDKARDYYAEVAGIVRQRNRKLGIDSHVQVSCLLFPPDRRRRDMDNAWKVVGDALTKAGVWMDDSLIRKLVLQWSPPKTGGQVMVFVEEFVDEYTYL